MYQCGPLYLKVVLNNTSQELDYPVLLVLYKHRYYWSCTQGSKQGDGFKMGHIVGMLKGGEDYLQSKIW